MRKKSTKSSCTKSLQQQKKIFESTILHVQNTKLELGLVVERERKKMYLLLKDIHLHDLIVFLRVCLKVRHSFGKLESRWFFLMLCVGSVPPRR
jgi:hypothetical protein